MPFLSTEQLAGPGYIILNVLRVLNVIALSSVVASSVVMLVKTFVISKVYQKARYRLLRKLTAFSSTSSTQQVTLSPALQPVSYPKLK